MTFDEYKEEILNGEKMEWYGTMVPRKLVTNRVSTIANMIVESISKMEGELSDMRKGSKEQIKRQNGSSAFRTTTRSSLVLPAFCCAPYSAACGR